MCVGARGVPAAPSTHDSHVAVHHFSCQRLELRLCMPKNEKSFVTPWTRLGQHVLNICYVWQQLQYYGVDTTICNVRPQWRAHNQ
jgi:hypothetical protein